MPLTYKNYSKDYILRNLRNIKYANAEMLFGFYNNVSIQLDLKINVSTLLFQGDIFAREMLTNRSVIDFKKFLGSYQDDWLRILNETYAYDRLKCIYYGVNSKYMLSLPDNLISFPGNLILMNALAIRTFNFSTDDSQPFNLYLSVNCNDDLDTMFAGMFSIIPDLKVGMSESEGTYSYVNFFYESVLKGLHNFKSSKFMKDNTKLSNLYYTHKMNDEKLKTVVLGDSNPLLNSFLSEDFTKFYFIMPTQDSVPEALRFNESLFISRSVGFTGKQLTFSDNNMYTIANVNVDTDPLIREDVYSVTGVKTEIVPQSMETILHFLSINTYKKNGGIPLKSDTPSS